MPPINKESFNANTVLLTVVLMLSAWTLAKVSQQGEILAGALVEISNLKRAVYQRE